MNFIKSNNLLGRVIIPFLTLLMSLFFLSLLYGQDEGEVKKVVRKATGGKLSITDSESSLNSLNQV